MINRTLQFLITHREALVGALALAIIVGCIAPARDAYDQAHRVVLSSN